MFVKICGITNVEDALQAFEAGADALGLVFADSSRQIDLDTAQLIRKAVPQAKLIGVFDKSNPASAIDRAIQAGCLDSIQLHDANQELIESFAGVVPVIRAVPFTSETLASHSDANNPILVDGTKPGSGISYDLRPLQEVEGPLIIAGGLTPLNVSETIRLTKAYGVDVSSGVCRSARQKDHAKVSAFIRLAKTTVV